MLFCTSNTHTHTHTHTHTAETENKLTRGSDSEKCYQNQNPEPVTAHLHFQGHKVFPQKSFHSFSVSIWESHCSNPGGYENRHSVPCFWCHHIKWEEWRDLDIFLVWQIVELFFSNIWGLAKTKTYFAKHFGLNF